MRHGYTSTIMLVCVSRLVSNCFLQEYRLIQIDTISYMCNNARQYRDLHDKGGMGSAGIDRFPGESKGCTGPYEESYGDGKNSEVGECWHCASALVPSHCYRSIYVGTCQVPMAFAPLGNCAVIWLAMRSNCGNSGLVPRGYRYGGRSVKLTGPDTIGRCVGMVCGKVSFLFFWCFCPFVGYSSESWNTSHPIPQLS